MKSTKPYLLRAMHEWIVDCGMTPHVVARSDADGLDVPPSAIGQGRVILNIAPEAVVDLQIDDAGLGFVARFGGVSHAVWLPIESLEGIYAKENGRGMLFGDEVDEKDDSSGVDSEVGESSKPRSGPSLRIVK
jgi:stringent starvation protein B